MSTQAQVTANRANAQLSTGPATEEGKAASSKNNLRHGFTGAFAILPWEKQEEFNTLLNELRAEHQPAGITEVLLVEKMARSTHTSRSRPPHFAEYEHANLRTSHHNRPRSHPSRRKSRITSAF